MVAIHDALQSVVKYFNLTKPSHVDDFKLSAVQYKAVFGALVACAILSGLTSWYSRIECASADFDNVHERYVEEWCYANSTFIVEGLPDDLHVGNEFTSPHTKIVYLRYYQWVTLALVLQATCFQIPRIIWKCAEGGRVRKMVEHVKGFDFATEEERSAVVKILAKYYRNPDQRRAHRHYFTFFALCQFLYFINVLLQITFTNAFLLNQFLGLAPRWLQNINDWNLIFPKTVKCAFYVYGSSGRLQRLDVLCVLAMNVLFEKLYILIWFLFAIALCAAIFQNLFVGMAVMSANFMANNEIGPVDIRGPSDWLLLKFLQQSLDCSIYREFLQQISEKSTSTRV